MFIKPLVPQIIPEGEVAFLEAEVTSKPEADFTWFRHGQKITADEELEVQITSGDNKSSLVLGELFEDDSGDYTVTAQNPIGRASSTATLLVEGEGAEEAEPPAFNPPLTPLRVMDGDEVRFSCRVMGNPKPRLLWLQNGRPIGHHREVRVTQTPDGRAGLEISEVFPEDAGDYTCIARNKAGEARTTANLAVECKSGHLSISRENSNLLAAALSVAVPPSVGTFVLLVFCVAGMNVPNWLVAAGVVCLHFCEETLDTSFFFI